MIANVQDIELRCAMIDLASSLNIIPLSILKVVGVPREIIKRNLLRYLVLKAISRVLLTLSILIECRANEDSKPIPC